MPLDAAEKRLTLRVLHPNHPYNICRFTSVPEELLFHQSIPHRIVLRDSVCIHLKFGLVAIRNRNPFNGA